jgi:hypothetical protein
MDTLFPGVARVAVRTPTLPPATHTNTWVLGEGDLTVVDPLPPGKTSSSASRPSCSRGSTPASASRACS